MYWVAPNDDDTYSACNEGEYFYFFRGSGEETCFLPPKQGSLGKV